MGPLDPKTGSPGPASFEIKGIGDRDGIPYTKVDTAKVCRIGLNFAFSFYQMDYNAFVNALGSGKGVDNTMLMPVAKIVMDPEGFLRFKEEFEKFVKRLEAQAKAKP
jgi:hypothetical protein